MEKLNWRKSRRSSELGDNCVEIADAGHALAVRDSKNSNGSHHTFTVPEMAAFFEAVREGKYDL